MKKISIIITIYNKEKYIRKCLESAIKQDYDDYDIIIIDDGSTDKSKTIIDEYINKNDNIKYYYKENTGIADTRNYAINKVKSEYFTFLDADDHLCKNLLNNIDKYLNNINDIVSFSSYNYNNYTKKFNKVKKPVFGNVDGKKAIITFYSQNNYAFFDTPWGYFYRTKFFKKNKFMYEYGREYEDANMTPIIISKAKSFVSTNIFGYYYVPNNESITKNLNKDNKKIDDKLKHLRDLYEYYKSYDFSNDEFILASWNIFFSLLHVTLELDRTKLKYYIKKIREYKLNEFIPNSSKSNKLYRKLFYFFPFFFVVYYNCMIYNGGYHMEDNGLRKYYFLINKNTYYRFEKIKSSTKNNYVIRIKRLYLLFSSMIKYLPVLKIDR